MNGADMRDHDSASGDAAEWFLAICASEEPTLETLQAWLQWLESSEGNRQAFEDVVQIWHKTPAAVIARSANEPQGDEYDGSVSVLEWRANQRQRTDSSRRRWHRPLFAMAATAAIATVGLAAYRILAPNIISKGHFATRVGEQSQLQLADGSRVILGANSKLSIDFQVAARNIRLESGEAYFIVSKDSTRPFVVRALTGSITAVGTSFDVRTIADRVTVTVTEGRVKVSEAQSLTHADISTKPTEVAVIAPGEQISYSPHQRANAIAAANVRHVDPDETARWREGWLVYRDEPLRYVIADIERYTNLKFELDDSAAEVKFSGAVYKDKIAEWIVALPEVADVTVNRETGGFDISSRSSAKIIAR